MRPRRTVLAAVVIVLALLAFGSPAATRAADDIVWIPGRSVAAIGFDLDGDGDHELVRLVADGDGSALSAEAWDVVGGTWSPVGTPAPLRPRVELTAGETVVGQLTTWRRDGIDRVLAITAHAPRVAEPAENCCVQLWELALGGDGLVVESIPLAGYDSTSLIQPLDVDADGTDELLFTAYSFDDAFSSRVDLLRWRGSALTGAELPTLGTTYVGAIANFDGVAGDDLLVTSDRAEAFSRLTWRGGSIVEEPWPGDEFAYPNGIIGDDLLMQSEAELQVVRWPRDGPPTTLASSTLGSSGFPYVATSGDDAVILIASSTFGLGGASSFVLGSDLQRLGQIEVPDSEPLWALAGEYVPADGTLFSFSGQFPVRRGETEVWEGGIVVTAGGPDGYRVRQGSPYVGIVPLGVVGPDDEWIIAGAVTQHAPPGYPAFLWAPGEYAPGAGGLRLLPRHPIGGTRAASDNVDIALRRAIEVGSGDGTRELLAGPDGFEIEVTGPVGTAIVVIGDGGSQVTYVASGAPPARITPNRLDLERDAPFSRTVVVVLPDGRYVLERWTGTFLAGDLEASATAETVPFALAAEISGETMPGAVISTAYGSATANADGHFTLSVDAPFWGDEVAVAIEDPFGRSTALELEVVGFVDYREWPWMALVAALVLAAGVVLYVRVPRMRTDGEPPPPEAPTLEEIEI